MSIYLALGTNVGNKEENLKEAIKRLSEGGIEVVGESPIYKTPPYGPVEQDWFLNQVVEVQTELDADELFEAMQIIEKEMGREKEVRWGPRLIDLDIIFYNDLVLHEKNLTIPHADMQNRKFVLQPMCDLNPKFLHPVFEKRMEELLENCNDEGVIEKI